MKKDLTIRRLLVSLVFPVLFIVMLWLVFLGSEILGENFNTLGILPRSLLGLKGIILAPLVHSDLKHLMANSGPLLILATTLLYFYRDLGYRVFLLSWLFTGIWVWLIGRSSFHIGASGLVYALAGFLTLSGFFRKHIGLIAISLLVIFQYGTMLYGVLPLDPMVSWESHLAGLLQGILMAWIFRSKGPVGSGLFWHRPTEEEDPGADAEADLPWDEYEVEGERKRPDYKNGMSVNSPSWTSDRTDNNSLQDY